MKITLVSKSTQETKKIGRLFADDLRGGEIIGLIGDLGGGKTTFIQGVALGLGIKSKVTSPTFVILKRYPVFDNKNIKSLVHFDLYRIKNWQEVIDLGWSDLLKDKKSVIIIEWADRIYEILPKDWIKVEFRYIDKNRRKIIFENPKSI